MLCMQNVEGWRLQASKQASKRARQVSAMPWSTCARHKEAQGQPICQVCCCALVPTRLATGPAAGRKCVGIWRLHGCAHLVPLSSSPPKTQAALGRCVILLHRLACSLACSVARGAAQGGVSPSAWMVPSCCKLTSVVQGGARRVTASKEGPRAGAGQAPICARLLTPRARKFCCKLLVRYTKSLVIAVLGARR